MKQLLSFKALLLFFLNKACISNAFVIPVPSKGLQAASLPETTGFRSYGALIRFATLLEELGTDDKDIADDTEEEPLTLENLHQIKSIVKTLQTMHNGVSHEVQDLVIGNKDLDVDTFDHVITPVRRTRPSLEVGSELVAKSYVQAKQDKPEVKEQTESTFSQLAALLEVLDQVFYGAKEKMEYDTYPNNEEYPDYDLSTLMKRLGGKGDGAPPLEYWFSFAKIKRLIKRIVLTNYGLSLTADDVERAPPEKKYKAFFTKENLCFGIPNPLNLVPLPKYTYDHWKEDTEFSRQFMNGVNPLMIEVVKDVSKQVTPELLRHFDSNGPSLQDLAASNRLFVVDYQWLEDLNINPHDAYPLPYNENNTEGQAQDNPRYFQAPQVILRMNENNREVLDVLAIQLDRKPDAKIYTKANSDAQTWLFVKSCVANCDSQFHEWVSHLGKTHLTMEPHILAIHNTLRQSDHKLFTFFEPLVKDTLLLNWGARKTLAAFAPKSFGDVITSVGTGQFMQLIDRYWSTYDFFKSSALPDELSSRGFDEDFDMPGYLYRHDGMKLWDAYGEFAKDFVDECYSSDAQVASDVEIQAWAAETVDPEKAAIKGFPEKFEDKKILARTLQTLLWIPSGLHAAVNFPQADYYGYIPNKPLGMRAGMEQYGSHQSEEWIAANAFPNMDATKQTISTAATLTLPSKHTIDKLDKSFSGLGKDCYAKFKGKLSEIGAEINARNKKNRDAGRPVYHYLHPSVVPASIDI